MPSTSAPASAHYRRPGWMTRTLVNRPIRALTRLGISIWGSRILETRGRRSGLPRRTPVNLLTVDGSPHLFSPRGRGDWVRNVEADDGRLTLILGRRREAYRATEVTGPARIPLLRAYLRRWRAEVGVFFEGVGPDSSDEELAGIADRHPVFALTRDG